MGCPDDRAMPPLSPGHTAMRSHLPVMLLLAPRWMLINSSAHFDCGGGVAGSTRWRGAQQDWNGSSRFSNLPRPTFTLGCGSVQARRVP